MKRIFIPSQGPTDWQQLLANPDLHWQRGASAFEIAVSWELAQQTERGFPGEIVAAFDRCEPLSGATVLIALPEHKVGLVGQGRPSQSDAWTLLTTSKDSISMAVEGKAKEGFGQSVAKWLVGASQGKLDRLADLRGQLELTDPTPDLPYQLFHRTASALIEARRFRASVAVMLVQSFHDDPNSWQGFSAFCTALGAVAVRNGLAEAQRRSPTRLFLGWVDSPLATDAQVARLIAPVVDPE